VHPQQSEIDERWFYLAWALISVWLLACALLVGGEFGDGYQTMVNARYFYGDSAEYYVQRGPLAGLMLLPVAAIVSALDLNPVDVRPYHLYSGLLHSAYLLGCWLMLKRSDQPFIPRIIAFAAAIFTVVFFANAPYLSHDLFPGLLFLILIFLCDRWIKKPATGLSVLLVLIGTAVTFIKQTYAIFWIAICIYALLAFLFKWNGARVSGRVMLSLFALAGLSGVLSWIGYGWFIGGELPDVSLIERPLTLLNSVSIQYETDGDISTLFPWDLYLRNLHNYGIVTVLLVVPGVVLAFRSDDARLRMVAFCWLLSLVILQLVGFKEVRYLAFLAPLSALLIAPVVPVVLRSQALVVALLAIIVVDQYRGLTMAAAQLTSTPGMNVTRFVGEAEDNGRLISSDVLSFAFMPDSPMRRDRYHGIFHLTGDHLVRLNEGQLEVGILKDQRDLGVAGIEPGDRVLYSNRTLTRHPPWGDRNIPSGLEELIMVAGNASIIDLVSHGDRSLIKGHGGSYIMFIPRAESGKQMPLIGSGELSAAALRPIYGNVTGGNLQVLGVVVDTLCLADRCTYY